MNHYKKERNPPKDRQTSPDTRSVRRSAPDPLVALPGGNSDYADSLTSRSSHRVDLGEAMQRRLEERFGVQMPGLKVFRDQGLNEQGAYGYAKGNEIHIDANDFNLHSERGQELLYHEAGHVVQQGSGMARGDGILYNEGLEHGASTAFAAPDSFAMPTSNAGPIQGGFMNWIKRKFGGGRQQQQAQQQPPQQQQPPPQPAGPAMAASGLAVDDLQGQRDYVFNASDAYRETPGNPRNIPAIAAQGKRAVSPLGAMLETLGADTPLDQISNKETPYGGGVKTRSTFHSPIAVGLTNQYMEGLIGQLDTPEMSEYLATVGNIMGGVSYDKLLASGAVSDFSNSVMSQLPTRSFGSVNAMRNGTERTQGKRVESINNIFGSMERAYSSRNTETGELAEAYRGFESLMPNYLALRSATMAKVLPHVRDEVLPKLSDQERALARPQQQSQPPQFRAPAPPQQQSQPPQFRAPAPPQNLRSALPQNRPPNAPQWQLPQMRNPGPPQFRAPAPPQDFQPAMPRSRPPNLPQRQLLRSQNPSSGPPQFRAPAPPQDRPSYLPQNRPPNLPRRTPMLPRQR